MSTLESKRTWKDPYCVKCRKKKYLDNGDIDIELKCNKNLVPMIKGVCRDCNGKFNRFVKKVHVGEIMKYPRVSCTIPTETLAKYTNFVTES